MFRNYVCNLLIKYIDFLRFLVKNFNKNILIRVKLRPWKTFPSLSNKFMNFEFDIKE